MYLDPDLRLHELALRVCGADAVLGAMSVPTGEFDRSLRDVCRAAAIPLDDVLASLQSAALDSDGEGLGGLVRHVVRQHHDLERREMPRLKELAMSLAQRHGATRPVLLQLADLVGNLTDELDAHLAREERVLFPYLLELERAGRAQTTPVTPRFQSLRHPLRIMSAEHAVEEGLLEELRKLTDGYACPADADDGWRELMDGLRCMDVDLTKHMQLEDGVLYPLSLALEAQLGVDVG